MPDFHNPTGRCMDALTRQRVAHIAARTRTTLVIDETMADLWYNAPPPPPLASFNPDAAVLTIGSAGKSFWGGLRIGWIRASARTIASLIQARDSLDLGTPLLEQLACSWLLENAATLLPPRRDMLKARRDMCETLMAEYFPRWRFSPPEGGLSFWVELPDMLATLFSARAESQGSISAPVRGLGWKGRSIAIYVCRLRCRMKHCAGPSPRYNRCGKALLNRRKIHVCEK